jgi:hypothetical protein
VSFKDTAIKDIKETARAKIDKTKKSLPISESLDLPN